MVANLKNPSTTLTNLQNDLIPSDSVIDIMIELQIQLYQLKQQIQDLQPAFFAACVVLNMNKIQLERAVISRRLTPGQWTYAPHILKQQELFKQLKQQFQKEHEPTSGRDITWSIKLLLAIA